MRKILVLLICFVFGFGVVGAQESSILVSGNTHIPKQNGYGKSLFVHENHFINPFSEYQIIVEKDGDTILGYKVGGKDFNENHSLFIGSEDSDSKKTILPWTISQEGVYKKTLLQEASYTIVNGVYTPNQSVPATSYYRVRYNHDTTGPVCSEVIFSQDATGTKRFDIQKNSWFAEEKYALFACMDIESGCMCDDDENCFISDDTVFSVPKPMGHNESISSNFFNQVHLESTCNSSDDYSIFYDSIAPDISFTINDTLIDTQDSREYISNNTVLYDGTQITNKRYYNIKDTISLKADSATKMHFELSDYYDSTDASQGVSGLKSYSVRLSKLNAGIWSELGKVNSNIDEYNSEGTKTQSHRETIIGEDISFLKNAFTSSGEYQLYISFDDVAGNKSRVVLFFTIVPNSVDPTKTTIEVASRNNINADNQGYYSYKIRLKDRYQNPIYGKEIYNLKLDCESISGCHTIKQNMLGDTPAGDMALEIFDQNLFSDEQGAVSFKLRSLAPGVMTESFSFEIFNWDDSYDTVVSSRSEMRIFGDKNIFLAPFTGKIESYVDDTWGSEIPIGSDTLYKLEIVNHSSLNFEGRISDFSDYIQSQESQSSFTLSGALDFSERSNIYFTGSLNTTLPPNEHYKIGIEISDADVSPIEISYVLAGKRVSYYLSDMQKSRQAISIQKSVGTNIKPVRIIGNLQGVGNDQSYQQRQNTTDLSAGIMRKNIRKNISVAIKSMRHNTTVGKVKYVDAEQLTNDTYILESNPSYETLIVRNGNIVVSSDFVPSGDMVGIISYRDEGYDVKEGYNDVGNIYIERNVGEIHAAIYADGAIVSTHNSRPIEGNAAARTSLLQNQLYIKGAIFTRNTLAGSTIKDGKYVLPGGEFSSDRQLAVQYDFNHIRRGSDNCKLQSGTCLYEEYFILEYDSRINTQAPELFSE